MPGGLYCCVYGCGNNTKMNKEKSYFSVPTDPKRLALWLSLIKREDLLEKSKSGRLNNRVCSDHFSEENITYMKTLNKDAVPSLRLPIFDSQEEAEAISFSSLNTEESQESSTQTIIYESTTSSSQSQTYEEQQNINEEMSKSRNRTYCCVYGCINNNSTIPDLSLFSVPNDPERRLEWLKLIGREDIFHATYAYRVCEEHFKPEEILMKATRKILKRNAVPTLKLPVPDTAENEFPVDVVEVSFKEEIEDAFSEHEEDVLEQLENRKRMNQTPIHVPPKLMKAVPSEVLTVEVERESEHKVISQFPVDFMKTVLNSQDEILTVLKSQVLLQDTDTDLMKFLRLLGAKLQRLDPDTRKEVQDAVIDLVNARCYNVRL